MMSEVMMGCDLGSQLIVAQQLMMLEGILA